MKDTRHFQTTLDRPYDAHLITARGNEVVINKVVGLYYTDPQAQPAPDLPELEWVDCTTAPADIDEIRAIIEQYGACEVEFKELYGDVRHRHNAIRYEFGGDYDALFYEVDGVPYSALEEYWAPWIPAPFNGGTAMSRAVIGHQRRKQ